MTAEQHLAEAERYVGLAHAEEGRDFERAAAYAAIASAHATIAQAKKDKR